MRHQFPIDASMSASSSGSFSPPSFTTTSSGSNMTGGTGATLYTLGMNYFNNGDVQSANDSVNGSWTYSYDDFNRLSTAVASNISTGCSESYDRYGNRWAQQPYGGSGYGCGSFTASFSGNNNRMDTYTYDAAGNLLNDGTYSYSYDAENRISDVNGGSVASYVYNAEGQRIRKIVGGSSVDRLYDLAGHVITELNSSGGWNRGEVYAGSMHLATYANSTTYFTHSDWLGTERLRSTNSSAFYSSWTSLPFGEASSAYNPGPTHFTGKDRDPESNLDYFGARYYSATIGRWMSPDWDNKREPVPYADLFDPQSLNLYDYVRNNPTSHADADGHCWKWVGEKLCNLWNWGHYVDNAHLNAALQRDADRARKTLSQMKGFRIEGQTPQQFSQNANNQQAILGLRAATEFIFSEAMQPCAPGVSCGIAYPMDFSTPETNNWSATFASEGEARAFARTKLGSGAVEIEPGKWRSADGKWQYRAKPGDVNDYHIHLEELNPQTGEVLQNLHLRWPEGTSR